MAQTNAAELRKFKQSELATYTQINRASPGEAVIYHTGELAVECIIGRPMKVAAAKGHRAGAWWAYIDGLCCLVQRRVGDRKFDYIAQRSIRKVIP